MKQKDLILILIPAFITTVLWVVFSVYHSYITSTIKEPLNTLIIPIKGTFDTISIDQIKARNNVSPIYEINNIVGITPTPTPTPTTPAEQVAPTEEITPTPTEVNLNP